MENDKKISIDIIDDQYDYVNRRLNFYYVKRRFDSIKVDYVRLKFNMSRDSKEKAAPHLSTVKATMVKMEE